MALFKQYFDYQEEFEAKYGPKTAILLQCGSFFEIYGYEEKGVINARMKELTDLTNLSIASKTCSFPGFPERKPLMAGFRDYMINKYIPIFIGDGFTVVVIEQEEQRSGTKRNVTAIWSPGTYTELAVSAADSNTTLCVYLEEIASRNGRIHLYGVASVDVITGHSTVSEWCAPVAMNGNWSVDKIVQYIQANRPSETIIYTNIDDADIVNKWGITPGVIQKRKIAPTAKLLKQAFQNTLLGQFFPPNSLLSPVESLELSIDHCARNAFVLLIDYMVEHSIQTVKYMRRPKHYRGDERLVLANYALDQLNIVEKRGGAFSSIYAVVNKTKTTMGRRVLRDYLYNPVYDIAMLNRRYDMIELAGDFPEEITGLLLQINDLGRIYKRVKVGSLSFIELFNLSNSLKASMTIAGMLPPEFTEILGGFCINDVISFIDRTVVLGQEPEFKRGYNAELDALVDAIQKGTQYFTDFTQFLAGIVGASDWVKLEYNDRDGYSIMMTEKRSKMLQGSFRVLEETHGKLELIAGKSKNVQLTSLEIKRKNHEVCALMGAKEGKIRQVYQVFLVELASIMDGMERLIDFIGLVDYYRSCAEVARLYGYVRPKLVESVDSYVGLKGVRHPIIERLSTESFYVQNDMVLGQDIHGVLLYGVNASGKSSLMKSVGIAVIMAQAGMFVAARECELAPYQSLYTRIANGDNIFRGQSTFSVEMEELRNILRYSDNRSLVLGDELCSGTESISAQSIVSSSIIKLAEKKTSFIFATHLHGLQDIAEVCELSNVCSKHLTVNYNKVTGKLIYDRVLRDGAGSSIYGLEVCKAMDMPDDFLVLAEKLRMKYFAESWENITTSKYNSSVLVIDCQICGARAVDTHHINSQCFCSEEGKLVEDNAHIDKNYAANLVTLCKKCHSDVHGGAIVIEGYRRTSSGLELAYVKNKARTFIRGVASAESTVASAESTVASAESTVASAESTVASAATIPVKARVSRKKVVVKA